MMAWISAYFLSGWIANLGVVPLLLFLAFLFAPDFVFLADLIFRVTLVFETMVSNPSIIFKIKLLPTNRPIVKVVFLLLLTQGKSWAKGPPPKPSINTLVISRGEQKELLISPKAKISLGNKEVLAHKYLPHKGKLLLKGRRLGFSDLRIWEKSGRRVYQVYVFSKTKYLMMAQLLKSLQRLPLKAEHQGDYIKVSGELRNKTDYLELVRISKKHPEKIMYDLKLEKFLQNQIISHLYLILQKDQLTHVSCENQNYYFICTLPSSAKLSKARQKYIDELYHVKFFHNSAENVRENFKAKLVLFHYQAGEKQSLMPGTSGFQSTIDELLRFGPEHVMRKNSIGANAGKVKISSYAEPILTLMLNHKAKFQMGTDIPIRQSNLERQFTEWKFSGLKGEFELAKNQDYYILNYAVELSFPDFSGTKEESKLKINLGEGKQVFALTFKYDSQNADYMPLLGKIPILGSLFTAKNDNKYWHQIVGIITIAKDSQNE